MSISFSLQKQCSHIFFNNTYFCFTTYMMLTHRLEHNVARIYNREMVATHYGVKQEFHTIDVAAPHEGTSTNPSHIRLSSISGGVKE